jgi:Spy/CpxP family protein refolding chaperone
MKRLILSTVIVYAATAATLDAQASAVAPMPRPGAMGRRGSGGGGAVDDPAQFLLGHTGELRLTDAQVTRLAAIARRSADRRRSLRSQMDSMRPERPMGERPDSAARARMRQRFDQVRPAMDKMREQSLGDRRDAIAVLTPDQQAQAWERIASSGRGGRGAMRRGGGQRGGFGRGGFGRGGPPGGVGRQGMRPRRMGPPNDDAGAGAGRRRPGRPAPEQQP